MQFVSIAGIYGLTIVTLLLVFLPVLWLQRAHTIASRSFVVAVLAILAIYLAWGLGRLNNTYTQQPKQVQVRIVQPNIAQEAKWLPERQQQHENRLWELSLQSTSKVPDIVVWPETAITLVGTEDVRRLEDRLQRDLPAKTILASGVLDVGWDRDLSQPIFYNRLSFYQSDARRIASYDKFHLVPFGEYLPFQKYWPVRPVAFQAGRFSAGMGVQSLDVSELPSVSPLICYEVLFPGNVALRTPRPAWLLNVTNDGWYGRTSGPYQHLAIARTRAIEEGLPLIRAANTGISAVIDPLGRLVDFLPLGEEGVLDAPLPPALKTTFFSRHGNTPFFILCLCLLLVATLWQIGQRKKLPYV